MGGKNKTNRTKNNARPSSSGRSAELLATSFPQFGFSNIKESGFPSFSLLKPEEFDTSLDSSYQLVLKKLDKKDATTKLKGLQEFVELLKNAEVDAIKLLLPIWPRFYSTLATDVDNRVREAAHNVQNQFVLKAKRNLAPFLKQLMAPWFISQYDVYPPAATAAKQAFKDAFPVHKFQEAIVFCQDEIIAYIRENLLNQTPESLSLKQSSPEEAAAKYERVIISCLQGYNLYFEQVLSDKIQEVADIHTEIVSHAKFWKFPKNKIPPIRAAWYKLLVVICQKASFLLNGKETQTASIVFANLDENEPTVLPYVWEAALLVVSSISEWWKNMNVDKICYPKLWKILKNGGQGNASVIYPSLLPLISYLAPVIGDGNLQFFNSFFENMRTGLQQKTVLASKSECSAVAQSLIECLQYIILKNHSNSHLCKELITSHLTTTLEWCLTDEVACHKSIFNSTATLIQSWSCRSDTQSYVNFFYDNLIDLFKMSLNNLKQTPNFDLIGIANRQIELLHALKHVHKPKKHAKVKFAFENESGITNLTNLHAVSTDKNYLKNLNNVVFAIGEEYVEYINSKQEKRLFEHLYSLVNDFDDREFFIKIKENIQLRNRDQDDIGLMKIYEDLLLKWLKSSELCCEDVVKFIFSLLPYLAEPEKEAVLTDLLVYPLEWSVSLCLAHPHNTDKMALKWLRNDKIAEFIVSIADKQISGDCPPNLSVILNLALSESFAEEMYVSEEVLSKIVTKLIDILSNDNEHPNLDACVSLSSYFSTLIYPTNLQLRNNDKLLLTMFKLSCKTPNETEYISNETLYELRTAWQDAITVLITDTTAGCIEELTHKVTDILRVEITEHISDHTRIDHLSDTLVNYLRAVNRVKPLSVPVILNTFFKTHDSNDVVMDSLCNVHEYVKGNWIRNVNPLDDTDITSDLLLEYIVWSYMRLNILSKQMSDEPEEYNEDDDDCDSGVLFIHVMESIEAEITKTIYRYTIGDCYLISFINTEYYSDILYYNTMLDDRINFTIKSLDTKVVQSLVTVFKQLCYEGDGSWYWACAAYKYLSKFSDDSVDLVRSYEELTQNILGTQLLGAVYLTQVFREHISYDNIHWNYSRYCITVLRCLAHCEEIEVKVAEAFGVMESIRSQNVPQFLYDNASSIPMERAEEIIEIVRTCTALIQHKFEMLSSRHWDFGVMSLVSWVNNCVKARALYNNYQYQALVVAVADMYTAIENQIKLMIENDEKNKCIDEWNDVLIDSIHSDLALLWLHFADQFSELSRIPLTHHSLIQRFGKVAKHFNYKLLFRQVENYPKWTKFFKKAITLLNSSVCTVQLWGYSMLLRLIPGIIEIDTEIVNSSMPNRKGLIIEQFREVMDKNSEIVNSILKEMRLTDVTCHIEPLTDSYTYTFAYLLLWDIWLSLCSESPPELNYQYVDWIKNQEYVPQFLSNLMCLMPAEVVHFSESKSKSSDYFTQKTITDNYFQSTCDSETLERYACYLFCLCLKQLPAVVRQWWTNLDAKTAQILERITAMYVSPYLCKEELSDVTKHPTKFKNMTIKVMPSAKEVFAVYTVDEASMELSINLPLNYPLGSLDVQCSKQIGGTAHKTWLLQLKKILHQNGKIWDGLSLWNNNLDKKFDGVEECCICFAVLHTGTYQLPKLSCQTCKKKFHSACLYKWFATSNKSSCPICRNLF